MKHIRIILLLLALFGVFSAASAQVNVGDVITCGVYEQDNDPAGGPEPIEWRVLSAEGDRVLVISTLGLDCRPFDSDFDEVTWENSSVRSWLNRDFYETAFSSDEKAHIIRSTVSNPDNPESGAKGGNDTEDSVFLLSINEAETFFGSGADRVTGPTAYAGRDARTENGSGWWWLRTPGATNYNAALVTADGRIGALGDFTSQKHLMVRPAMWLEASGVAAMTPEGLFRLGEEAAQKGDYGSAARYYQQAADQGNMEAQNALALLYNSGNGVEKSGEMAAKYFQMAAEQGNVEAQYNLAFMYEYGLGIGQSDSEALKYYRMAAEQGDSDAAEKVRRLSMTLTPYQPDTATPLPPSDTDIPDAGETAVPTATEMPEPTATTVPTATAQPTATEMPEPTATAQPTATDTPEPTATATPVPPTATDIPEPATEEPEPAEASPEDLYADGHEAYLNKDYPAALANLQPAADAGYAPAQAELGWMYYMGFGTEKSDEEAAKYFKLAADQGDVSSQYNLAFLYEYGQGVPQSFEDALKYYRMAAEQGDADAAAKVEELQVTPTATMAPTATPEPGVFTATPEPTQTMMPTPTLQPEVLYQFGRDAMEHGDYAQALTWFHQAADAGHAPAYSDLAELYYNGYGTDPSYEMAVKYYQLAAGEGNGAAKSMLAYLQEKGFCGAPSALHAGDVIRFGRYEQDEKAGDDIIGWIVLTVEDGRALLISETGLEARKYHDTYAAVTWAECDLRQWLNGSFLESAFDDSEKALIPEVLNSNPANPQYHADGGRDTKDRVFLLSIDETEKYLTGPEIHFSANNHIRKTGVNIAGNGNTNWWLRSIGANGYSAAYVNYTDQIILNGATINFNSVVRPAIWITVR